MRSSRFSLRRAAFAGIAASTVLVGVLAAPSQAAPPPASSQALPAHSLTPVAAADLATQLNSAGTYADADGAMVITVTDQAAAERVRAAGGTAQLVSYSGSQLAAAIATLDRSARIPGTAWAVDPASNQVVVTVDSTVTGAALDRLMSVVDGLGSAVRVEQAPGVLGTFINGGEAIYGGGYRCSLGFNVRSGSTYYLLTAGHCGNVASTWYSNSSQTSLVGTTSGSSFPGNDYALIRYTSSISHPGTVDLYNGSSQDITTSANAYVGQAVKRSGSTTHVHSGTVQALNATVNYAEGTVYGLIKTNVCAEGGDSGGPLFASRTALGLTSGGSGNCSFGGTTYFQPVTEALSVYGVSVY